MLGAVGPVCFAKDKPPQQYQIPIPPPPDFSSFNGLEGQWVGTSRPAGEVRLAISAELDKHFLIFHGEVSLASTATVPASKESWMGILSAVPAGDGFTLRVFSSTGFMSRYHVTVNGTEISFNPEGGESTPAGWLFRRTWLRTGPDAFTESVQAAPPGKPFFDYYTVTLSRVVPQPSPSPDSTPTH